MHAKKKIGILGLGNLLLHDEGFGVHFINHLNEHYHVPDHVTVLDGGTAGIMLAPFIEDAEVLYVIDTAAVDDAAGSIHIYSYEDIRAGGFQARMSPHQVGLLDILDLCMIRETAPETIVMLTVVPRELRMSIGLSPVLEKKIAEIMQLLADYLAAHQTVLKPKTQLSCA